MSAEHAKTILFVDDEKRLWTQCREYVQGKGYSPLFADDGFSAVKTVREQAVDLVVMDLNMPNVDGELSIEVLQELKPDIPVIVVSGFVTPDQIEDGIPGATRVFLKPVSMRDLLAAVREAWGSYS